jgi:hypothetical protein
MVKHDMKRKILILLAAIVAVTTPMVPQAANAISFNVAVGDQPYYHGGGYWHEGYYWGWVPGHYSHRYGRWVPGHYNRRGAYNNGYARTHYRYHRVWVNDATWR